MQTIYMINKHDEGMSELDFDHCEKHWWKYESEPQRCTNQVFRMIKWQKRAHLW